MRPQQTCVLAVGEFGSAVADILAGPERPGSPVIYDGPIAAGHLPVAETYVLVSGHPAPAALETLDDAVFAWGCRLVPVTVEHPYLRLGPVVVPGRSPCYHCFAARCLQHALVPAYALAVTEHFRDQQAPSWPGYLPPVATIAAAWAQRALHWEAGAGLGSPGAVQMLNMLTFQQFAGAVVGVHGCRRCGLGRDEHTRSTAGMAEFVGSLVGGRAGAGPTPTPALPGDGQPVRLPAEPPQPAGVAAGASL
jgi:bacteriocin biosynthesis cyclodehydratase domain-containing protein